MKTSAILKAKTGQIFRDFSTLFTPRKSHRIYANVGSQVMYEGKNIHFSEFDNKPLCSFSTKLCKQRRLNGYAFCIRHVLEDKSAPFRQCNFVAKYNRLRCTNPIPEDEDRTYCNSHLQVLGLVPKKVKKVRKPTPSLPPGERGDTPESSRDDLSLKSYTKKAAKDKKKKKKKDKDRDRDRDKHNKHAKNKSKSKKHNHISQLLNSSPSEHVDLNALSSLLLHQTPPSALNHHGTNFDADGKLTKQNHNGDKARTKSKSDKGSLLQDRLQHKLEKNKQRIRLQRDKEIEARAVQGRLASPTRHSPTPMQPSFSGLLSSLLHHQSNLYSGYHLPVLPSSSSTMPGVPHSLTHLGFPSMPFHLPPPLVPPSATVVLSNTRKPRELYKHKLKIPAVDRLRDAFQKEEKRRPDLFPLGLEYSEDERSSEDEAYGEHTEQSLHSNKSEKPRRKRAKDMCLKLCKAARDHAFGTVVSLLGRRNQPLHRPNIQPPPEKICCSKEESGDCCQEETMPYSKHCFRHILEDENQMIYFQCSAEFPGGLRCIEPAFDVLNELPLCLEHAKRQRLQPRKKQRKKTKPSALTKPNKRKNKKQRRQVRPQKPIPPAYPQPNNELNFYTSQLSPGPDNIDTEDITAHLGIELNDNDLTLDSDGDHGDLMAFNDEANELSDLLPKLPMDINALFGKNGDSFMSTKEEQEEFERTLLSEVSKDVKDVDVEASLEQISKETMEHLTSSQNLFGDSDNEDNGSGLPSDVGDYVPNMDGADGLPSDLQGAANRLLADTMRQNSIDALSNSLHPTVDLASTVPSNTLAATAIAIGHLYALAQSLSTQDYNGGHFAAHGATIHNPMTAGQVAPNHGTNGMQMSPGHPQQANPTNGMVPMNASAMLNQLRRQYSNDQALSPHGGALSPHTHPMMAQFSNPLLPTQPIASNNPLLSAALTAPQTTQQPMAPLPSFSQTWSAFPPHLPNHHNMMGNQSNGPSMNLMGFHSGTFPQKVNFNTGPTEANLAKNPLLFNQTAVAPATPSPPTHGIQGAFLAQPQTPSPGHPVFTTASTVVPVAKASPAQTGSSS
ncbi:LOW QUALITY PROTEIN: INO80 complex subunit D-like [Amphiura filiformis]|uniref:LOW QUALITY PROTEIN: INO80 complex subunit D-like n=1 Tax=Amphiura filiformis TaxID=82378 RepID=UPI003B21C7B2